MATAYWQRIKDSAAALRTVKRLIDHSTARARAGYQDFDNDPGRFMRSQDLLRDALTQFGSALTGRDSAPDRDIAAEAQAMLDEDPAAGEQARLDELDARRRHRAIGESLAGEPAPPWAPDRAGHGAEAGGIDDEQVREDAPAPPREAGQPNMDAVGDVSDEPPDRGRGYLPPSLRDDGLPRDPHEADVDQVLGEIGDGLDPAMDGQFTELDELDDIGNEVLAEWMHQQDLDEPVIDEGPSSEGLAADPLDYTSEASDDGDDEPPDNTSTATLPLDPDMAEADRLLREIIEELDAETVAEFAQLDRQGTADLTLFEAPRPTEAPGPTLDDVVPDSAADAGDEPDAVEQASAAVAELQARAPAPHEQDDIARTEQLALWHHDDTHAADADDSDTRGDEDTW